MTVTASTIQTLVRELKDGNAVAEILDIISYANGPNKRYYVNSSGGNDANAGTDWNSPVATIDAAINLCAANDIILVAPGHNEDLGNAQINADVAGISIIGLGNGPQRPMVDFTHANASINIGANGVLLANLQFRPSVTDVAIGVDVEAAATGARIVNCEFLPGEAGDGTDEFVIGIDIKAGCTGTTIDGLRYSHHASAAGAQACVVLTGASDKVTVQNSVMEITGAAAVACIQGLTTLSTRVLIDNCVLTSDAEPGIELLTGTTGTIRDVTIFTDLATIDAATVADGCAHFNVLYCEVGNEAGTLVKTESVDD